MERVIVLVCVIAAVVFHGGGALADVRFDGLRVALRQADGTIVTVRVTPATRIECGPRARRCGLSSLWPGVVVVEAEPRPAANRVRVLRTLVVERPLIARGRAVARKRARRRSPRAPR
jgi:hypothetical protein